MYIFPRDIWALNFARDENVTGDASLSAPEILHGIVLLATAMDVWAVEGYALSLCQNDGAFRPSERTRGGKCRRPSEVGGKGRPTESSCFVRFLYRRVQLVLTRNSPCDVCIKCTIGFELNK